MTPATHLNPALLCFYTRYAFIAWTWTNFHFTTVLRAENIADLNENKTGEKCTIIEATNL